MASAVTDSSTDVSTRAWQSPAGQYPDPTSFPELQDGLLAHKAPVGICLSGGGSRAYISALGQLRGLHDSNVLQRAMYLTGVSGGSWAAGTYAFAQPETFGNDDTILLGPITPPANVSLSGLNVMDKRSARNAVTKSLVEGVVKYILEGSSPSQAWIEALGEHFLDPVGVSQDSHFTWDNTSKLDIISRNPSHAQKDWIIPPHQLGRPFPILETTLLTPSFALPVIDNNFTQSEVSPLYVGRPFVSNITYKLGLQTVLVGGLIEPHAVGSEAPAYGLGANLSGILRVPSPPKHFSLSRAIGESSWFPGAFLATVHIVDLLGDSIDYWSPAEAQTPRQTDMYIGDGGDLENIGLMSMLRRVPTVRRVLLFNNPSQPFNLSWDPTERLPTSTDMTDVVPAYFGIFVDPLDVKHAGWDYTMNQVFNRSDFAPLVKQWIAGAKAGTGMVATAVLTTIHNPHWGIPAGLQLNVTWTYLSRCFGWEASLSPEMQKLVVPTKDANNTASLMTSGEFENFPHYPTSSTELSVQQVNLLASLSGWVIQQHPDVFRIDDDNIGDGDRQ